MSRMRKPEVDLTKWDFVTWIKDGSGDSNLLLIEKNLKEVEKVKRILENKLNKLNRIGGREYVR